MIYVNRFLVNISRVANPVRDRWPIKSNNVGTDGCPGVIIPWQVFDCNVCCLLLFSVQERMEFCFQNATCPADVDDATKDNCCIWHANIHTCHPRVVVSVLHAWPHQS